MLKDIYSDSEVAPHAGAWIETCNSDTTCPHSTVAPHAGAWIETPSRRISSLSELVAPHAGAWIETFATANNIIPNTSRPMRVRGLKQEDIEN